MKNCKWILSLVLAVVMAVLTPLQALAAGEAEYLSDVRLGYGDEGKASLEAEGYTVWADLNANEGGNGSAVWLGYLTTDDRSEAITDIALMNMKGGYSFDAYLEELEELNRQVTGLLANIQASIEEFRANYDAGNPFAQIARENMNKFTEDDTPDASGNPTPIGDVIYDGNTPTETLHRIFLEGNTEAIRAIEQALALACTEPGGDNVLSRVGESRYPERLDPAGNAGRTNLKAAFPEFHSAALEAKDAYETVEGVDGGFEGFIEGGTLSDEDIAAYTIRLAYYEILDGTELGNSGMTLLEFALLDEEEPDENGEVLEDEYLDMLAQAMTPGQLGIVANVGIMTILGNAVSGENYTAMEDELESAIAGANEGVSGTVSVYLGVDRTLFEETGGIALTSEALREKAASEQSEFGRDNTVEEDAHEKFLVAAGACFLVSAFSMALGITKALSTNWFASAGVSHLTRNAGEMFLTKVWLNAAPATSTVVAGVLEIVVGVIAIIASVVLTIIAIMKWREKPVVPHTEYTEIPRAIVDKTEDGYVAYYAAKLAGASADETDTTKLYGDLNALNTMDEWVALYYTKNPAAGAPLTADIRVSDANILSTSDASQYAPVHMFGIGTAADLNQYNTKNGVKSIYLFLRTVGEETSQSGSVFTTGTVLTGAAAFLVGGGLAAAVTYLAMKKKRVQPGKIA